MPQLVKKERNSNFELLRILSMILIVGYHFSGVAIANEAFEINTYIKSFIYNIGLSGVNLFFMMTGFFLIGKKDFSGRKVLSLLFQIVTCNILLLFFFLIMKATGLIQYPDLTLFKFFGIIEHDYFSPVSSAQHWFLTAYLILFVMIPVFNPYLQKLNVKGYVILLLVTWFFWFVLPYSFYFRYYHIQRGFFFYALGGFFQLFLRNNSKKQFILGIVSFCLLLPFSVYLRDIFLHEEATPFLSKYMLIALKFGLDGIFIPLLSIAIFLIFKNLSFQSKIVNGISASIFSIYIMHGHGFIRPFFEKILPSVNINCNEYPLNLLIRIAIIFVVCISFDVLRRLIFTKPINIVINGFINYTKQKLYKKES